MLSKIIVRRRKSVRCCALGVCQEPITQTSCLDLYVHTLEIQMRMEALSLFFELYEV